MTDLLDRDRTSGPYAYAEPTWQEELAASGDDPVFDQMNLSSKRTGVDGFIFVSTEVAQHGPRVKYYRKLGKDQPSFSVSIEAEPRVLASSLDARTTTRLGRDVIAWVTANRQALLDFWREGAHWTDDEVDAFKDALVRSV